MQKKISMYFYHHILSPSSCISLPRPHSHPIHSPVATLPYHTLYSHTPYFPVLPCNTLQPTPLPFLLAISPLLPALPFATQPYTPRFPALPAAILASMVLPCPSLHQLLTVNTATSPCDGDKNNSDVMFVYNI